MLEKLPLSVRISTGHDLSLQARVSSSNEEPILLVEHGASLVSLKPSPGKRLSDGSFGGERGVFSPSRIMDECTGGGACCSYSFNTAELGLPYSHNLMLDIYKLG